MIVYIRTVDCMEIYREPVHISEWFTLSSEKNSTVVLSVAQRKQQQDFQKASLTDDNSTSF